MLDGRNAQSDVASDADIDQVVQALRAIDHKSSWDRMLEVGRLVFESIVAGDEREWRSRRSQKNVSLRKLVQHPGCPFKKSALCSAVNIHLFVRAKPAVTRMPGVTPTHVAQILGLPPARALEILSAAASAGWSVRELGQEVRSLRKEAGERRGRPASPIGKKAETMARRAAAALRRMHEQLKGCPFIDSDSASSLGQALTEITSLVAEAYALPALSRRTSVIRPVAKTREVSDVGAATA